MQKNKELFRPLAAILVLFLLIGLPSQMVQADYAAQNGVSYGIEFAKKIITNNAFPRYEITQEALTRNLLVQDDFVHSAFNRYESRRNESEQNELKPTAASAPFDECGANAEGEPSAYATTVRFFDGPDGGWKLRDRNSIRGSKKYTYSFDSSTLSGVLSEYLNEAIAMWGGEISLTKASASSNADLMIGVAPISQTKAVDSTIRSSNGKIISATITVNISSFSNLSNAQRIRIMARELGRVYGLDFVSDNSTRIMSSNLSSTASVTSMDKCGIRYVTGAHAIHSYGTWLDSSSTYHTKVCSTCKGILHESHTANSTGKCPVCGHSGPITAPLLN